MTSMNVSLPEQMKDWVEQRIAIGQYNNASEYIRDLIRQDQAKAPQWRLQNKAAIESYNTDIETKGTLLQPAWLK